MSPYIGSIYSVFFSPYSHPKWPSYWEVGIPPTSLGHHVVQRPFKPSRSSRAPHVDDREWHRGVEWGHLVWWPSLGNDESVENPLSRWWSALHGKPIGKWWLNGVWWWFYGSFMAVLLDIPIYPLVKVYITMVWITMFNGKTHHKLKWPWLQ